MNLQPTKVNWNIISQCPLNCQFCYRYIDSSPELPLEKCYFVINKLKEAKCKLLIFSGGEPLLKDGIVDLINYANQKGLKTRIDTTGIGINKDILIRLNGKLDWIGLPLDGSSKKMNSLMRGDGTIFENVMNTLKMLRDTRIKIKINTLVSKINIDDIINMTDLLQTFNIKLWSLYQFWPLERGKIYRNKFEISRKEFLSCVNKIKKNSKKISIEIVPYREREYSYFLISQSGFVYTTPGRKGKSLMELGHIQRNSIEWLCKNRHLKLYKQNDRLSLQLSLFTNNYTKCE